MGRSGWTWPPSRRCWPAPTASPTAGWPRCGRRWSCAGETCSKADEREVGFDLSFAAAWPPADPDPGRHLAWVRRGWEALRSHSIGVYVNFVSDEGAAGVQAAYGTRLERLVALKDRYDPDNVFRLNANIPPSRTGR
jgi:Berberine and berberine like